MDDDNDGSWTGLTEMDMNIIMGCLELAKNSWMIWLEKDELPPMWEPRHASHMIDHIDEIMHKSQAAGVPLPAQGEQEHEEEPIINNVYQFPNTGSNSEEE